MSPLEYARAYAARGWSVIPLVPGTKRPAVELRPFLTGERRAWPAELEQWWGEPLATDERGRGYGIGIVCGRPSGGLVVLDVDPRNGGQLDIEAEGLWFAPRVVTGGGGLHVYCSSSSPVSKGKTSRLGIDRQGDGSFVVAPPSRHPGGGKYLWFGDDAAWATNELAPLPAWALERPEATAAPAAGTTDLWVAAALARPEDVSIGTQHETLTRLAWWAAGHLDRDVAEVVLLGWAARLTLGNPRQPWALADVRNRLDSAYEKREVVFSVESAPASAPVGSTSASASAPPPEVPASAFVPVRSLEFPDQDWVVEDFVAPGAFTEVIGKVKKGKSTLVYQLVRSVLTGEPFLGRAVSPGPVVVLTEQEGASLKATLTRAGLYGADLPLVVVRKSGLAALGPWPVAAAAVVDLATWLGAKVIVVDTLARLARIRGDAENSSGSVAVLDPLDRARSAGVACVFVRHARKGASGEVDDIADAARGSSAITGDMDVVIRHRPHGGDGGDLRVLSWESRLTDDPDDVALRYVDGRYEVVEMPDPAGRVRHNEGVDAMRRALAGGARTYAELRAATGMRSDHTIAKYKKIVEDGEALPAPPARDDGSVKT